MDLLKKAIVSIAFVMVSMATVQAAELNPGQIYKPEPPVKYQTFLQTIWIVYDFQKITLADEDLMCYVEIAGKGYEIYADVYADYDIAVAMNQTFEEGDGWGNVLIVDFSDEVIADNHPVGDYVITIPSELVTNEAGDLNPEQEITFTVVSPVEPESITPKNGMYPAAELSNVQVTFSDPITVITPHEEITIREKNNWIDEPIVVKDYTISNDGKSLCFDFSNLTRGVNYMIEIPESFVLVDNTKVNSQIWMEYMNWDGMATATLVSAPDAETSLRDLKPLVYTWDYQNIHFPLGGPDATLICGYPDYGYQDGWETDIPTDYFELVIVSEDGTWVPAASETEANGLYLDVEEFLEDYSGYRFEVVLPAGFIVNDEGMENPPQSYAWEMYNIWIDPEFSISGQEINVAWPYALNVTIALSDSEILLEGPEGYLKELMFNFGGAMAGEVSIVNSNNLHGLSIDLSKLNLSNGEYTLTIPMGYVYLEGSASDENVLNDTAIFKFSVEDGNLQAGVSTILNDKLMNGIYDLNGRRYNTNQLENLKKGIYIINGKKVMIK